MDVDAYEDRAFGFEIKLKELDNADDDFRAAEQKGTPIKSAKRFASTHSPVFLSLLPIISVTNPA